MKYLLKMLFFTIAFLVIAPGAVLYCLWDFDFSPVKQLYKDYMTDISRIIYNMVGVKLKNYPF
jgi:hypothetical protein